MDNDKDPSDELKALLLPYRDEAAVLQVPLTGKQRHFVLQQLLVYNVIEKRRQDLIDLASGMNELCLLQYLKIQNSMGTAVFPRQAEAVIDKEEVMRRIILQDDKHPHGQAIMDFLYRFLDEISQDAEGKIYMITVNCSTQIELLALFGLHSSLFCFLSGKWESRKGTGTAGTKTLGAGKERKKYS